MSRSAPQTAVLCRLRNWDAVTAKIHWDGSKKRPSRSLNQLCPNQKINAAEKQKEIKPLTTNLKGRTMNPLTQSKNTTILPVLIALMLASFGLSPQALA